MNDVRMPIGISDVAMLRDAVSTAVRNAAPRSIEAGTAVLASVPAVILVIWGMTSPTQPIIPATATVNAVISDADAIAMALVILTGMPRDRALALATLRREPCEIRPEPGALEPFPHQDTGRSV